MAYRDPRHARLRRDVRGLLRHRDGVTLVEFALVAPLLFGFIFGIIEAGHAVWTISALNLAVEDAARCVSVSNVALNAGKNPPCINQASMQTYAASRTWGLTVPKTEFTLSTPSCGYMVSINHRYVPLVNVFPSFNIQAQSCFPQWQ